jgi:hypothetical protein
LVDSQPGWYIDLVTFTIEIEREDDGRWLAEVPAFSGVMAYVKTGTRLLPASRRSPFV